jgi:acyl-coenzyme A thioesterase PaaI-like protein
MTTPEIDSDPWQNRVVVPARGGPHYGGLVEAMRNLQDAIAEACPTDEVVLAATADLEQVAATLRGFAVDEWDRCAGRREELPGRGHALLLPFVVDEATESLVRGRVVFRPFYLGGNGAAHGGTVPLLFDEVVGRLASAGGPRPARTAYLTVNYRAITPIGVELQLEATVDRREGRKRFASGRLYDGDRLIADCDALFVELRPGQP